MAIRKIDFAEAKEILDTHPECIIVDVREEEEYITGHAVGARLFRSMILTQLVQICLFPTRIYLISSTAVRAEEAQRLLSSSMSLATRRYTMSEV